MSSDKGYWDCQIIERNSGLERSRVIAGDPVERTCKPFEMNRFAETIDLSMGRREVTKKYRVSS